ncbi:MAG TPA: ATP synthase F0 subunit B [Verrucomicrobiae bacterium]|jgi:F-type H+-transporting ATPase subunit b|nr:ATP synthase F0 subunit B [Verrucomicrobiae bacterium]
MSRLAVFIAPFLWSASAFAGEAEEHAASASELIFPFLNFLIFLFLIYRFALPLVRDYLNKRRADIAAAVHEGDEAKRKGEALLAEYRGRLASLGDELRAIRDSLRADAEKERAKLLADAAEIGGRIKADADFLADQEVRLARQEVRKEIVDTAAETAERLVRDNLTPADQKRIVGEFLTEVGASR